MSVRSGDRSDGSDIEVEEEDDEGPLIGVNLQNFAGNDGNVDQYPWLQDQQRFLEESDDDEEFEGFDADWKYNNFTPRQKRRYTLHGGSSVQHPEEARAAQYFELLWGPDLWETLVTETNRYADQERTRNPPPPHAPSWKPVDVRTMKAFMGLVFTMGVLVLPHRTDYWRVSKRMFKTAFNAIMPRDRFNLIWRYLHLQDNATPPAQPDKLRKIRPLITYLNDKFRTAYTPDGDVTVDESMVKFKGRLGFRQYLPAKPVKWGIKLWALAESSTGYLHQFQVYTGKEDNRQEKGLSHRVVTDLLTHLEFTNVRVYMDNFYTSSELLTTLFNRGIYGCGTIRTNRKGLPPQILPRHHHLDKHQYRVAQKDDLTFCVWQDTKPVLVLSNFHDPGATGTVNRRTGQPQQTRVRVPKMLEDYQNNMKGVDLFDQMVGYYMPNHRSRKWWRRLFHHLQMAAAYNAYVIAKDCHPEVAKREWPQFQDFVEDLAEDLIGNYSASREAPNIPKNIAPVQHVVRSGLFAKKKNCTDCRAKAAPGARVTATMQGCQTCNLAVCNNCVADHIQRRLHI